MLAILRSRVPSGKRSTDAPTRIEVSFPLTGVTAADFIENGRFDADTARRYAIGEFTRLFGAEFAKQAMAPKAIWNMDVI